jgi:hypothetical protein
MVYIFIGVEPVFSESSEDELLGKRAHNEK